MTGIHNCDLCREDAESRHKRLIKFTVDEEGRIMQGQVIACGHSFNDISKCVRKSG